MKKVITISVIAALMAGCSARTDHLRASSWDASQVNTQQEAKVVNILSIMPAKVFVDNSENQKMASTAFAILGAVAGGLAAHNQKSSYTAAGAAGGMALGSAAGNLVESKTEVDGVNLGYSQDGKIYTSTQVGLMCEYKMGTALIVSMKSGETRIQPNAQCPAPTK